MSQVPTITTPSNASRLRTITWHAPRNREEYEFVVSAAVQSRGNVSCFIRVLSIRA
jgi:hypothetical protein